MDERDHGRAAPAEEEGVDRHALPGRPTPAMNVGHCAAGGREARVGVRGRAPRSRASSRCPASRSRASGGSSVMPSHQMSPSSVERDVGEDRVALDRLHRVRVGLAAPVPGATPKKPASGLIGVEAAVLAEAASRRCRRRSSPPSSRGAWAVSIARLVLPEADGKAAAEVLDVALRRGQLDDQHVLGQPALVAGHHRRDPQGEALLAEQGVAAIARAERPDLAVLREVDDVLGLVAGPGDVVLAVRERRARPSARRGRTRRRRRAPRARRRPSGS